MARGTPESATRLSVATMTAIGHIRLRRSKMMTVTVANTLTQAMVEEAMVANSAQMTITVENALKRVTAEEAMVANSAQIILMTPPVAMVHNAMMTALLMVAVVLAASPLHMEVRELTTTAGMVARNDMMTNLAVLMDKLVS
jgi:hypothetical protein